MKKQQHNQLPLFTGNINCNAYCRCLVFLFPFSFFQFCNQAQPANNTSNNERNISNDSNAIIIVIHNKAASALSLSYQNAFSDDTLIYQQNQASTGQRDTIKLSNIHFLPLRISYGSKNVMFPLLSGDSLKLSSIEKDGWTWQNPNSSKKQFDTLFLKFSNQIFHKEVQQYQAAFFNGQSPPDSLKNAFITEEPINKVEYTNNLYKASSVLYHKEMHLIDSLHRHNELSSSFVNVYGAVITAKFADDVISCYEKTKSTEYLEKLVDNSEIFKTEFLLYDAGAYKTMLNHYLEAIISKGEYHKVGKNSISINYETAFDSSNHYLSGGLLDYIQFICLKHIKEQSSTDRFQNYLIKFPRSTKNDTYIRYFTDNYPDLSSINAKGDYIRAMQKEDNQPFSSLLLAGKGKIMYLDIWASWCAPCRAVMNDAKQLQTEFGSDILHYSYLSIDENLSDWRSAASIDIPSGYPFSYVILNPKESPFLRQVKLSSIPRYILFDKQGKIINDNAPGPDTKEIREILKKIMVQRTD